MGVGRCNLSCSKRSNVCTITLRPPSLCPALKEKKTGTLKEASQLRTQNGRSRDFPFAVWWGRGREGLFFLSTQTKNDEAAVFEAGEWRGWSRGEEEWWKGHLCKEMLMREFF